MRTVSDALCREYGLSLIKPVRRGMPYAAWQAEKEGKPNRRKALREDIDRILANENIESLEAFYDTLRAYGYAVMTDRKYVAICQGITEQLKAENALEWTQRMNNIRACAKEIVEKEIIFA